LSRIRAVLRRTDRTGRRSQAFVFGSHSFDAKTHELTFNGNAIRLTSLEGELLLMRLEARGRVVPREAITLALQDREPDVFDRSLDVHISRLRAKLGEDAVSLQTVRGIGYVIPSATERT
jgi:DNA-binding response OmpR family regulator